MLRDRMLVIVGAMLALISTGCDSLLQVDLPGSVTEGDLTNPTLAATLANSVVGNTGVAWDDYILWSTSHSDEWTPASGNAPTKRRSQRQIDPLFAQYVSGLYSPLHRARSEANEFYALIDAASVEDVPDKPAHLATIRAWGTWPLIAFGETFCGTPLDGDDVVRTPAQLLQLAEAGFTEAITLASAAGLDDLVHMARVGRARARLGLQDYAGAINDAEMVPESFQFDVAREAATGRLQNSQFMQINGLPSDGETRKRASVAPSYWQLEWKGTPDPRVNIEATGTTTYDFFSEHYRHDKINSADDDVRLASWDEAQLFIAEAAAMTGDLDRARLILAGFHDRAGIPELTEADIPTQDDVIQHVIEERRRVLFAESGARLRDMLRWRGTQFEIPFLGEPGSDAPDGRTIGGELYGDATCFPVPAIELQG